MVFAVLIFIHLKLEMLIGPVLSIAPALDNFNYH